MKIKYIQVSHLLKAFFFFVQTLFMIGSYQNLLYQQLALYHMWQTFLLAIWVITCFWTQRNCYFSVKKSFRCESLQTNFLLFSGSYFLFCFKIWEHFVRSNERNIVEMILDKILFLPPQGKKRRWSRKVYFIIVKKYGMKKKD